jgi:hypothetical protein
MVPLMLPYTAWPIAGTGLHATTQTMKKIEVRTRELIEREVEQRTNGRFMRDPRN